MLEGSKMKRGPQSPGRMPNRITGVFIHERARFILLYTLEEEEALMQAPGVVLGSERTDDGYRT